MTQLILERQDDARALDVPVNYEKPINDGPREPTIRLTSSMEGVAKRNRSKLLQRAQALKADRVMGRMNPPHTRHPSPPTATAMPSSEMRRTLDGLINPVKRKSKYHEGGGGQKEYDDEDPDMDEESDVSADDDGVEQNNHQYDEEDEYEDGMEDMTARYPAGEEMETEDPMRPSEGFTTLEEEKSHILFQFNRLKKQGIPGIRTFTAHSDIREMRSELNQIREQLAIEGSVKFQRKILMAVVSTMEYMNRRYDPLDLKLEGWSESVMESVGDYDTVFERLHHKYKSKVSCPPEIELLLMVGGSAFMFHFSNSILKAAFSPATMQSALQANPDLVQNMMRAMAEQQQQQQGNEQQQQYRQGPPPPPSSSNTAGRGGGGGGGVQRPDMKGPPMDFTSMLGGGGGGGGLMGSLGGLMGGLGSGGGGMPNFPIIPPPQPSVTIITSENFPHSRGKTTDNPVDITDISSNPDDDRLSDIPSEDLNSLPDDLTSLFGDDLKVKDVIVRNGGAGKGRKKTAPQTNKKVLVL